MNSIIVGPNLKRPEIILDYIKDDTEIIACDRGSNHLFELEILADLYIGDFDSIDPNLFAEIPKNKLKKFPTEKNYTDFELALREVLENGKSDICYCFGFLGGRLDHALANILLLADMRNKGLEVVLVNDQNEIHFVKEEEIHVKTKRQYISYIPLEDTTITMTGFKYPVEKEKIVKYSTMGVSNEYSVEKDEGEIVLHEGSGFLIFSDDKKYF